jgi:hypothetical protein
VAGHGLCPRGARRPLAHRRAGWRAPRSGLVRADGGVARAPGNQGKLSPS